MGCHKPTLFSLHLFPVDLAVVLWLCLILVIKLLLMKQTLKKSPLFLFFRIFSVLSAILYLGNVTYKKKATGRDEGLEVGPPEVLDILSQLLKVEYPFHAFHNH